MSKGRASIKLGLLGVILLACSCVGPLVEVVDVDKLGADERDRIDQIKQLSGSELSSAEIERVAKIEAVSCKNKIWDAAPSREDGIEQLKFKAAREGATAIGNITCSPDSSSFGKNCWSAIVCSAIAYKASMPVRVVTPSAPEKQSTKNAVGVAVPSFSARGNIDGAFAEGLSAVFETTLADNPCIRIVAEDVIQQLAAQMGLEQACGTEECQIDIAKHAQASFLARGIIANVGDETLVSASLINLTNRNTVTSEKILTGKDNLVPSIETLGRRISAKITCTSQKRDDEAAHSRN